MAIDRIGKGAGLPPAPTHEGAGGAGGATKTDATFKVDRPDPTRAASESSAAARSSGVDAADHTSPLARLRAGEIDVHGYIDLKVDHATAPLKGLSTSELDEIKSVLRDQMRSDPGLADLVRTATGKMPTPSED